LIPRCTVGKGISGAVRYIFGEGRDPETGNLRSAPALAYSRVAWFGGTGFGFEIETEADADLARRVMEFDARNQASRTRRCEKDCLHLSLGWRPGETPTPAQMAEAAKSALAAMGMANARALFAIHNDESYAHIHIVASKIDPATGRAYDLKENYIKLSRWAEAYERTNSGGVVCAARAEANALRDAVERRSARGVLDLMTRQRATFTRRDLERVLSRQITVRIERARFVHRILCHAEAVALCDAPGGPVTRYTTRTVLDAEAGVLQDAERLVRRGRHAVGDLQRLAVLGSLKYRSMAEEQMRAVRHATRDEGLALIDGQAGTGKSFTLSAIRDIYCGCGYRVIGLAPTNAVAQDMRRDGFAEARTLHAMLFALQSGREVWKRRTAVIVDEAAMIDTALMATLLQHARAAGVKLILVGDDRQLASIDRGGMFAVLKDRHGAAELREVRRQKKNDDRRATELMAEGKFYDALCRYEDQQRIHWTETQDDARAVLVRRWAEDSASDPARSRFVFAYTNLDVDRLNRDLREVRKNRGELGAAREFETRHGRAEFAVGDRVQFTGTDKSLSIYNGNAGIVSGIKGSRLTVMLDGSGSACVEFDADAFNDFRHGYAGTIYKGQGRTIDQTYLYHSEHWRSAASYVALSRHREKAELFVARTTAANLGQLARQMGRIEERRAASHFYPCSEVTLPVDPARSISPSADAIRDGFAAAASETTFPSPGQNGGRHRRKAKERGRTGRGDKGKSDRSGRGKAGSSHGSFRRRGRGYRDLVRLHRGLSLRELWRRFAMWFSQWTRVRPFRPPSSWARSGPPRMRP
jgi:Ti-type conjugative transfer relaxase TraA